MSHEYCWECGESYARDELFDIPIFNKGFTFKWCFNCAMKQLEWSDYKLIKKPKKYNKFKVKSIEDDQKEYEILLSELILCFEAQYRKIKKIDSIWGELQQLASEIPYGDEDGN